MTTTQIIFIGFLAVLGWILAYLFWRQIMFNYKTALPVLNNMKAAKEDLIVYDNAKKYTIVSIATCIFVIVLFSVLVLILKFIKTPLKIAFFAGFLICILMLIGKMNYKDKHNFESFCSAYYRFVPDDQLRTDMYNRKFPAMKLRCHDLGVSTDWIPSFKEEKA